ncbi:MAG: hypothetical protein ABEI99_05220 [Halobaculum sp.]
MACPHLDYRSDGEDTSFDTPRAYCTVTEQFVQPMRADICNERYDLDPAEDCEFYRDHHGLDWDETGAERPTEESSPSEESP